MSKPISSRQAVRTLSFLFLLALLFGLSTLKTRGEHLPIKTYTTADGLAHDTVNRILSDSRGFLWFATAEGLSRFDGYQFTNYRTEQGLPSNVVTDFLETRQGVYWIATVVSAGSTLPAPALPDSIATP